MASQAPASSASASSQGPASQRAAFGDDLEFHFPDERNYQDPAELDEDGAPDTALSALRYAPVASGGQWGLLV